MWNSSTRRASRSVRRARKRVSPRPRPKLRVSLRDARRMNTRTLLHVIESMPASDGAGVNLRRSLGSQRGLHVDPFLMLDEFYSDNPHDYIGGFPEHPNRGFETVTHMLAGPQPQEEPLAN